MVAAHGIESQRPRFHHGSKIAFLMLQTAAPPEPEWPLQSLCDGGSSRKIALSGHLTTVNSVAVRIIPEIAANAALVLEFL
jgi:hypothetical protein